jgi:ATP-dependent Clp protease ATP-binding subunit ClpA
VIKLGRAALESSSHPENEMVRDADLDAVTGSGSVIVAIDEAHRLLRGSSGRSEAMDLIKMMVTEQRQRLILCTNESSALKGIDEALDRRMTIVRLAQADRDEVLDEILPAKADLASERGIDRVAPAALELAYAVSRQIAVHAQPHASVALLDASLARAELRGDSALTAALVEEVASKALGGQRADANACAKAMRANIVGHDRALDALTRAYCAHQARLLDLDRNDDDGPFAFILQGPPGVGRRTTARALHRFRCGEGAGPACVIAGRDFDKDWSVTGILGAPPGYVGYGRQSPALRALKDIPRGVIIIEHPEDAHETFATRVVLPILRGALTLSDGHIVSTSGACVAVVTGAGADTAATRRAIGFTAEAIPATGARIDPIRRAMPEVLAAIGARRVFWLGPLGADDVRALVRMWLRSMDDTARLGVADHDRLIDAVIERAVAAGPGGGVRALRRAFDDLREALS